MRDVDIALVLAAGVLSPAPSGGSSITVDDALSDSSENPVQNKVVAKEVDDLKSALDTIVRSGVVNDTVSGSIASFADGADNIPVKDLTVAVEPVQDLHGYDNPWPAGGGKNLLWLNNGVFKTGDFRGNRQLTGIGIWVGMSSSNYLAPNNIASYTIGDNSLTVEATANGYGVGFECKLTAGQQYTLSWVGTNAYVGIAFYDDNGEYLSYVTSGASPKTFTVPESTANAIIVLRGDGANVTGEFSNIQLEEGQTATAYSPYANICPISGWTGANVTRTGKNLIDIPASVTKDGITFTKDSDGYVTASPSNGDPRPWGKDNAQFLVNLAPGNYKFVIKVKTPSASQYSGWEIYSPTGVKIAGSSGGKFQADEVVAFTASASGNYYIMAKMHTSASRLMVVKDGADTSNYEPYTGDTYSITFPSEAGTVYSGTLDVTTGKLTVTHGNIASYSGETMPGRWISSMDVYSAGGTPTTGAQVVYELATPQTYQLTPTEVTTLLAQNNIWADCGDSTVNYRADTKLYIDKKIAALAASMN